MLFMEEIWKDVVGYEGKYLVSNLGRIKSLPKKSWKGERVLKETDKTNYCFIDLCKDGTVKKFLVHRLVAIAFIPNPEGKPQVNHINGIKRDNKLSNLEWVTRSENQKHSIEIGLRSARGEKNSQSKLTKEQVLEIYHSNERGFILCKNYNIKQSTICDIKSGRSWYHITGAEPKRGPQSIKK